RVRALTPESVLDRDEAVARGRSVGGGEIAVDVGEERGVHALEAAVAYIVRLRPELLLSHAGPEPESTRNALPLHGPLHHERWGDIERLARVVPLAVPRSSFDERRVKRHARFLRRLRNAVDVAADRDHGLARTPCRHPRRRDAGDALLDREAILLE